MMKEITWRPYQIECKQTIKKEFQAGITEQLIVQATGTGKRLAAINLMQHFKRTLFIAHREELIMQAYDDIVRFYPMQCGIIKGSRFEIDKKYVVASVQTLYNRLDRIDPKTFDNVVIDEAHHYISRTYLATARHFQPRLLTGWTATPKRLDGLSLSNLFQKIVFQYKIEDGIKDGWLANIDAYQIQTQTSLEGVRRVAGDFNQKQLSERVDCRARNALIVDRYAKYCKGEQAIGFCVDIDHAYNLRDVFREAGYVCEAVVSDTERCPDRSSILERFARKEIDVLTNVNILTEGYDYEDIGCILMARPTQSESLYIQCIGRGTRLKSESFQQARGHAKCTVLDFVDNAGKHSLVNAYTLEAGKPIEERIFISDSDREKLIEARERRIATIEANRIKDKKINLLRLPTMTVWQSEKMLEPATEKQIKFIRDLGLWQPDVEYTKAMASELIGNRPASATMKADLRDWGYDVSDGATRGQYSRIKFLRERKNNQFKMNTDGK
jgi:superfamily II DNA or RNA helicase